MACGAFIENRKTKSDYAKHEMVYNIYFGIHTVAYHCFTFKVRSRDEHVVPCVER